MPEITEIVDSEDEYQDAVNENTAPEMPIVSKTEDSNAAIIDDIIKQQGDLHLGDDKNTVPSDQESTSDSAKDEPESVPEYIHDEIDEEALKEKEKSMTHEELEANKERAQKKKLEANDLFKNNECEHAIDIYTEALSICPTTYTKDRAVLYGNRAAAKIKIENKKSALTDCSKAIELWPEYVRALIR